MRHDKVGIDWQDECIAFRLERDALERSLRETKKKLELAEDDIHELDQRCRSMAKIIIRIYESIKLSPVKDRDGLELVGEFQTELVYWIKKTVVNWKDPKDS